MKTLTNQQLHKLFTPIWCHDKIIITQEFGNPSTRYQVGFHTGVDLRTFSWLTGDNTVSPINGRVTKVWYNIFIGWSVVIEDIKGDVKLTCEIKHIRKPNVATGDLVTKGEFIAKSGIILIPNQWWTAPHTHLEFIAWYKIDGGWLPNYENGFAGRINPTEIIEGIIDIKDLEGKDIKTSNSPDIYLVKDGKRYKYEDEVSYSAQGRIFARDVETISDNTIAKMPYDGIAEINYTKNEAMVVKQILGLLKNNPNRAEELNKKYF